MILAQLPIEEQATAYHESSHALLAEILGLTVTGVEVHDGGKHGVCYFREWPSAPWVSATVLAAGHAVERWRFGQVIDEPSFTDRRDAARDFERAGLDERDSEWAVRELESRLWPVFTSPAIAQAVRNVAEALVTERRLTRAEFLGAARPALRSEALAKRVRRFCRGVTLQVLADHLEEVE